MLGTLGPEILNLLGLPPQEEEDTRPMLGPAEPTPVPPQMAQGVAQGQEVMPDSEETLPPGLELPPTAAEIRAAGGAPGRPVTPQQLAASRAAVPPPTAAPEVPDLLGLGDANPAATSRIRADEYVAKMFEPSGYQTDPRLAERLNEGGLLAPWQRALLSTEPGDIVQTKLTERFGTGKKGAAKQFLYDILSGFAYGDTSRGILGKQVAAERDFALKLQEKENVIKSQQTQLLKADLTNQLNMEKNRNSLLIRSAGMYMTDAQKATHEANMALRSEFEMELKARGFAGEQAKTYADTLYTQAKMEHLTKYRGSSAPSWIFSIDSATEDTIKQFGFDPQKAGADNPEQYAAAKKYFRERQVYWAEQWASAAVKKTGRDQWTRLQDTFVADASGTAKPVHTFLVKHADGTSEVKVVPLGGDMNAKISLSDIRALTPKRQEIVNGFSDGANQNASAYQSIAAAYADIKKKQPGATFRTADLGGLATGMLKGNNIYAWAFNSGLIDQEETRTSNILLRVFNEMRTALGMYAISGKQVSEIERKQLRAVMGPMNATPQNLAEISLMNYYLYSSSFHNEMGTKAATAMRELGRVKMVQLAFKASMDRLERGDTRPMELSELADMLEAKPEWKKALLKQIGQK